MSLPAPDFDPLATFPEGRPLRDAARARDWAAISTRFGRLTDPAAQLRTVRVVAGAAELDFLERVFAGEPTSALAGTLLAFRLVNEGWNIRGNGWASTVGRNQWTGFFAHLYRAEQILIEVTARHPDNTNAWCVRLIIARGLRLGQAEALRRYDRLAKVAPQFYPAQREMIQQLCPKWSGSFEAMHGFAVDCTKASPPGSITGGLVAEAHLEHWLLDYSQHGEAAAAAYLKQAAVQHELAWAAAQSVLHPACRPVLGWVEVHCSFAMAFSVGENFPAAAAHFQALYAGGNLADESPWDYLGDPATTFVTHRDRAFQRGYGR